MSELAVVSSRRSRLQELVKRRHRGARMAMRLLENPTDFLSTVQVGITLIGLLAGAYSGATLAEPARRVARSLALDRALRATRGDRDRGALPHVRLGRHRRARAEANRAQRSRAHRVCVGAVDARRREGAGTGRLAGPVVDGWSVAPVRIGARSQADGDGGRGAQSRGGRHARRRFHAEGARDDRRRVAARGSHGARDHDASHRGGLARGERDACRHRRAARRAALVAFSGVPRDDRPSGRNRPHEGSRTRVRSPVNRSCSTRS